jgi:hypothetical protein
LTTPFNGALFVPPGTAQSTPASSSSSFGGGTVISNVKVVAVFWGSNVASTVVSNIGPFFTAVTNSTYFDILNEFDTPSQLIGRGSLEGNIRITPSNTKTSLTDVDIGNELGNQIRAKILPAPDSNTMYMVYFPPGVSINNVPGCGSSCVAGGFCGCHKSTTQTINPPVGDGGSQSVTFPFGIMPDFSSGACSQGCGSGTLFQNTTLVTSHELAETVTDPFGNGWTPEIGDSCNQVATTFVAANGTTYTAQQLASNVVGTCIARPPTTIGVFRPAGSQLNSGTVDEWLLRNSNTAGNPDMSFSYGGPGDVAVVGDWTGINDRSVGVFRPAGSQSNNTTVDQWLLRSSNTAGNPDISFSYGGPGDIPVVGDWTGTGTTTVGVFRPAGSPLNNTTVAQWLLRNSNTSGNPDITFSYGGPGDLPVVGDWTGIGKTTIGVFRPAGSQLNNTTVDQWLLRNSNTAGNPDISFSYGGPGDKPVAGDWTGTGKTTIGVFRPAGSQSNNTTVDQWLLRNSNTAGNPDISFSYGGPGDLPVVGPWRRHL